MRAGITHVVFGLADAHVLAIDYLKQDNAVVAEMVVRAEVQRGHDAAGVEVFDRLHGIDERRDRQASASSVEGFLKDKASGVCQEACGADLSGVSASGHHLFVVRSDTGLIYGRGTGEVLYQC